MLGSFKNDLFNRTNSLFKTCRYFNMYNERRKSFIILKVKQNFLMSRDFISNRFFFFDMSSSFDWSQCF